MARGFRNAASEPDVSVVIVHRNAPEFLRRAVQDVAGAASGTVVETVVVDDGSLPPLRADVKPRRSLAVVVNEDVRGFAAAANQGASLARARYLLFLDVGVRLVPGSIAALLELMRRDSRLAAVGPVWNRNGERALPPHRFVSSAARALELLGRPRRARTARAYADVVVDVDCVPICAALLRTDVFRALGGFDEGFSSAEDQDWCWRAARRGYRVAIASHVGVDVDEFASTTLGRDRGGDVHRDYLRLLRRRSKTVSAATYRVGVAAASFASALGRRSSRDERADRTRTAHDIAARASSLSVADGTGESP